MPKPHLLTLSFDDGFTRSFTEIATIHERHGLAACLNVMALGDGPELFAGHPGDRQIGIPKGDFALWNSLAARGHEIMPHGLAHEDYGLLSFEGGRRQAERCLQIFTEKLHRFNARTAVFNLPYNSITPELEAWLPSVVRAVRRNGDGFNPLPHAGLRVLNCIGHGHEGTEEGCEQMIAELLARDQGWLIYNLHGLDGEGWGPVRTRWLEDLLARLATVSSLAIIPAGRALTPLV